MHSHLSVIGFHRTPNLWLRVSVCVIVCLMLAACGFRMKGVAPLPFSTIYTNIPENTAFGSNVRRNIVASSPHTRFVNDPQDAEVRLIQLANEQIRHELSIDADGQVEEYELILQFVFQLTDAHGRVILPVTELRASREIPYDPDDSQAKHSEIRMIFEDMQQSMVARIVRHLSASDVIEAFEQSRSQPPPQLQETIDPADIPQAQTGDQDNEWDGGIPDRSLPFD